MGLVIGDGGHARDILATLDGWESIPHHKHYDYGEHGGHVIIGINDPQIRAHVAYDLLLAHDIQDDLWVHPTAYLGIDTTIEWGTHVNYGACMTRTKIGRHTTIGPGVDIGGDVTIGDRVNVCMGALIGVRHAGETVTIGDDATIGAGAVVLHDIPAGETWVGNPARKLR